MPWKAATQASTTSIPPTKTPPPKSACSEHLQANNTGGTRCSRHGVQASLRAFAHARRVVCGQKADNGLPGPLLEHRQELVHTAEGCGREARGWDFPGATGRHVGSWVAACGGDCKDWLVGVCLGVIEACEATGHLRHSVHMPNAQSREPVSCCRWPRRQKVTGSLCTRLSLPRSPRSPNALTCCGGSASGAHGLA
jgi:hypothetical protein